MVEIIVSNNSKFSW